MRSQVWLPFRIILEIESSVCLEPAVPALFKTTVSTSIAQAGSNHTMCFLCLAPLYTLHILRNVGLVPVLCLFFLLLFLSPISVHHCGGHSSQTSWELVSPYLYMKAQVCFEDWLLILQKVNISILALQLGIFLRQLTSALTGNCGTITTPEKTHPPLN